MANHYLIHGDSKAVLQKFPENSIHLAITSPPYFNAREYSQWNTLEAYLKDMKDIFSQVFRVLDNHRIFVLNVGDINCQIGKQPWTKRRIPLGALFTVMLQEIGFEYVDNYIWHKGEPQSHRHMNGEKKFPFYQYPINCYEHMLVFHKHALDKTRFPCPVCGTNKVQDNSQSEIGVQSWECNNESCPQRSEGNRGKRYSARSIMMQFGQTDENKIDDGFRKKWRKDIVSFNPVIKIGYDGKNKVGHTAPFPEDIPEMAIRFYSYKGDTVLDPFAGSFTTSLSAIKTGRNSIGIDLSEKFVKLGKNRLSQQINQKKLFNPETHEIKVLNQNNFLDKIKFEKSKVFNKEEYVKKHTKK